MDERSVAEVLIRQDGGISRRQVLELGGTDNDIRRLLRQRRWARAHAGVYVDHTGPLTWQQRAWAVVLYCEPAALAGASALDAHGVRGHHDQAGPILVCIDESRCVVPRPGIEVVRIRKFSERCQLHLSPPRMRIEPALVTEASRRVRADAALAVLGDAVQQGRTTPARLASALHQHPRLSHRRLLREVLDDVAAGAYSALEGRYLADVERPHGLPVAARQRRARVGRTIAYRDVEYVGLGTTVELDGRIGHEQHADTWADLDRDLATAVAGEVTLRAGWKQVSTLVASRPPWSASCGPAGGADSPDPADPSAWSRARRRPDVEGFQSSGDWKPSAIKGRRGSPAR